MNYGYVYKTTNLLNGKVYVGQRKGEFDANYYGSGFILKQAIRKEGVNNFKIEVMGYNITKEQQNELERQFISECRKVLGRENVYNITDGGEGFVGKHTKETISKMKRHVKTQEHKNNIGKAHLGVSAGMRFYSTEERLKRSKKLLGVPKSEDAKRHMKEAQKKRRENETIEDTLRFSNTIKEWWKKKKEEKK
jgi:hypothetical protein